MMSGFAPRIIGFLCHWCSYEAADRAGRAGMEYPAGVVFIRVLCSGRVDPRFILHAFREGADGVAVLGCRPGDCHYKRGNLQALKRHALLRKTLADFGIAEERLRLDWVSADERERLVEIVSDMASRLTELGSLVL